MVGVVRQRRRVHVDGLRRHEAVVVHEPDAGVVRGAPDAGVRGDRQAELPGDLEGRPLGERRVARDVERQLQAEQVAGLVTPPAQERLDRGVGGPLPGRGLDVAVRQDEPSRHRAQGVDGGLGVVDGLQAVRPVDGGGDAGLERVPGRDEVAGVDVLGTEGPAVLEVVPDEVLGERPVGAVAAHRGLPHVPVRVDHARHDDAAARVDLLRPLRDLERRSDCGDPVADDEHVRVPQDGVRVVHGQHGAAAQDERPVGLGDREGRGRHGRPALVVADRCPLHGQTADGRHHPAAGRRCQGEPAAVDRRVCR